MSSHPDPELVRAYERAVYVVDWGRRGLRLVPGACVPNWRLHFGATPAAFITACNPRSRPAPEEANVAAMAQLRQRVAGGRFRWLEGEGRSADGEWPAEASLLVLGIEGPAAQALAAEFDQNALLVIDAAGHVSLAFTQPR